MAKKKGASGLPASAGKNQTAQSGGINHTFGGGKGGTKLSKNVTKGGSEGHGRNGVGLDYTIRSSGGDKTVAPWHGRVGGTPPLTTGGLQKPVQSLRKIRKRPIAGSQ